MSSPSNDASPLERRAWLVEGRVQGVGFREWTRREAERLPKIRGFVRNLADGRVEVVAEGPPSELAALAGVLSRGPLHARVTRVSPVDPPAALSLEGFVVLH